MKDEKIKKNKSMVITPTKLELQDIPNAGLQIYAYIPESEIDKSEFSPNAIFEEGGPLLIGTEPWIQFPKEQFVRMRKMIFQQMVDLWNATYRTPVK